MKPHRRKSNPPRREKGSGEQPAEPIGDEQQVPADPPAESYDPGQALAEESQPYVDPAAAAADPNQAYVDPNQAYVDPNAAADPNQAYVDPNQAYVDPNAAADPNQAYVDPNQAYVDPNAAADPNQAYVDPNQAYVDPTMQQPAPESAIPPPPAISTPSAGVYDEGPSPAPAPVPQAAAPAPKKKVVSGRVASRRPVTKKGGYKRPKTYQHKEGISMMTVFLALVAIAMLIAVAFVMMPKDMSAVKGYPIDPMAAKSAPRNILKELQTMLLKRDSDLVLSEAEVNQYLNQRLQGQQEGPLAPIVKFKGVYADFSPDVAEFVLEREIFGFPITMTSQVVAERSRGFVLKPSGWTIGKIELSGNRNLKPVIDAFVRLRQSFQDEYEAVKRMADVRFEQDKLVIDSSIR